MTVKEQILEHAKAEYPKECCGVIVDINSRERYIPCRNISDDPERDFLIHQEDYADAEDQYNTIHKIVHSHPKTNPQPSQADLVGIESTQLPWIIVNPLTEQFTETLPTGYKAPLEGRVFSFGVLDCYTLIQDYYKEVLNINLPYFERKDKFWERGEDLYMEGFEKAGFYKINLSNIQPHDVLVTAYGSTIANHGAVYLGNEKMLHHVQDRLSIVEVFGGYWLKALVCVLRHVDINKTV